jgi:hypothetical protein
LSAFKSLEDAYDQRVLFLELSILSLSSLLVLEYAQALLSDYSSLEVFDYATVIYPWKSTEVLFLLFFVVSRVFINNPQFIFYLIRCSSNSFGNLYRSSAIFSSIFFSFFWDLAPLFSELADWYPSLYIFSECIGISPSTLGWPYCFCLHSTINTQRSLQLQFYYLRTFPYKALVSTEPTQGPLRQQSQLNVITTRR